MKQVLLLLSLLITINPVLLRSAAMGAQMPGRIEEAARSSAAPAAEERGIIALDQSLRELTNPFTVMCVAAHPEDVERGTLAYYHKKLGARAVTVIATRGESEDNAVTRAFDESPGVVNTREAIAAARIVGSDVYFLNLIDFGASKSAEEALSVWGHDEALRSLVRALRLLRPDVIITAHDAKSGSGQHQAVARLLDEAFAVAADAKRFPEAGSVAWQARRLFQKIQDGDAEVTINLAEYDSIRGRTYSQISSAANNQIASQIFSTDHTADESDKAQYKLIRSASKEAIKQGASLLDGLVLAENLARSIAPPTAGDLTMIEAINMRDRLIESLREKLIEKRAEGSVDDLRARYGTEFFRVIRFTETLERALALALGVEFEVSVSDKVLVSGQKFVMRLVARNGSNRILPMAFHWPETIPATDATSSLRQSEVIALASSEAASKDVEYELPSEAAITLPHSTQLHSESYYPVGSALPGSQPAQPFGHRLLVFAEVGLSQTTIFVPAVVRFDVAPQIEISITPPFALVKDWASRRDIEFVARVRNRAPGNLAGALWVVPLALAEDDYEPAHISFSREDEEAVVRLKLKLPISKPPLSPDILIEFRREKPAPPAPLGSAKIVVKPVDFEISGGLKIGYVSGPDKWLDVALTQLGVEHSPLPLEAISVTDHGNSDHLPIESNRGCGDLARFDAIIIDRLAYSVRPELFSHSRCLLRYVRQGGNLVVFYQRAADWNAAAEQFQAAPFSIKLSGERITIETASVKLLVPDHILLLKPNKITADDFAGWSQERAVYLPKEWASDYTTLLETSDPGEEPQKGGLLVARYGEGSYVYTSYTLRRQLLDMNPGAYRVLANILSFAKTSKAQEKK